MTDITTSIDITRTVSASTDEIELVGFDGESGGVGDLSECFRQSTFDPVGKLDVGNHPAAAAHQMMVMVVGQGFAQLEVRVVLARRQPMDEPGMLEHRQVPVQRTLGEEDSSARIAGIGTGPVRRARVVKMSLRCGV